MPELPEVDTVRRTLSPIIGASIERVWWSGKALRLGRPVDFPALRKASRGATLSGVRRLGKYLLLDLLDREHSVLVHLGMSGRLRHVVASEARPPHTHVEWTLADTRLLRFSDPRRFGQVELVSQAEPRQHPSLAKLGPDPIVDGVDPALFYEACRRTGRPIKVALLDQALVAGVGNIYASEALWLARIHPETPANQLSRRKCEALALAIVDVMKRALEHGGTSLRDFVSADGHAGEHSHYLWVYDREDQPCPRSDCSGRIRRQVQQNRATYYCPRCARR